MRFMQFQSKQVSTRCTPCHFDVVVRQQSSNLVRANCHRLIYTNPNAAFSQFRIRSLGEARSAVITYVFDTVPVIKVLCVVIAAGRGTRPSFLVTQRGMQLHKKYNDEYKFSKSLLKCQSFGI